MRFLRFAFLYTGLALGANTAMADVDLTDLRTGDMKKLVVHSVPKQVSKTIFTDPDGNEHRLADFEGRVVLLNFWATWCAPCRKEMPSLQALSEHLQTEDFAVVPVATGRNQVPAIRRFFAEIGIEGLPIYLDPRQKMAREMGVLGLPVSVILDRDGHEVARLTGDADWASEEARAVFSALLAN